MHLELTLLLLFSYFVIDITCNNKNKTVLPACVNNQHKHGAWINNIPSKKSFYCCEWDKEDYLHNVSLCNNVKLDPEFYHGSNDFYTQVGARGCRCDMKSGRNSVSQRESYEWVPYDCKLHHWNSKAFCKLLNNRIILHVGDSTMQQTASTLMSMIKDTNGGCSNNILLAHDYHFDPIKYHSNNTFVEYVKRELPDIVVVSAGPHIRSIENYHKFFNDKFIPQLNILYKHYNKLKKQIQVIFKTINPGHLNCTYKAKILKSPQKYPPQYDTYNWGLHPIFDMIAYNYSKIGKYKVLDMSPLYYRADSHPGELAIIVVDCLHYCVPGPIDLYSILLYNMLRNKEIN